MANLELPIPTSPEIEMVCPNIMNNEYLKRLMIRYLSNPSEIPSQPPNFREIIKQPDLTNIKKQLQDELNSHKDQLQNGQNEHSVPFIINALLHDKLTKWEQLISSEKQKLLLTIGVFIVPIITNLLQFFIVRYIPPYSESGN